MVVVSLIIVSSLAQIFQGLVLVRIVTRSDKATFDQVGDQVSQVSDQVGQGQGQELDNISAKNIIKMGMLGCFGIEQNLTMSLLVQFDQVLAEILSSSWPWP